jgi:hypothetical protein
VTIGKYPLSLAHYPAWIEPLQGRRRTRFFPSFRRLFSICLANAWPEKIVSGIAAGAAASRSLTRLAPYRARPPVLYDQEEIMSLEQHIEELRAELRSISSKAEIRQIEAELEAALEELDRHSREDD